MSRSAEGSRLRVRFVVHHYSDRAAGMSGATYSLGDALAALGCDVSYYHFDNAFASRAGAEVPRMLRFPWRVAADLAAAPNRYDVIDASTGDAWVWCFRDRPGNPAAALVTRSHGLEHVVSNDLRARAARGETTLSRRYPLYHGGFRLWEVKQSLRCSDAQVFLNEGDREFAIERLGLRVGGAFVLPNGVSDALLAESEDDLIHEDARIQLVFIGSWIPRKGIRLLVDAIGRLASRGVDFSLRLLGTGGAAMHIKNEFPATIRDRIDVTPRYEPHMLNDLVAGGDILLHPSWTEGFSLALVEGMARGLAPVATRSGGATAVVKDGISGLLIDGGSGDELAAAVSRLATDRVTLLNLRRNARAAVQELRWANVAAQTLDVYRSAIARRAARTAA